MTTVYYYYYYFCYRRGVADPPRWGGVSVLARDLAGYWTRETISEIFAATARIRLVLVRQDSTTLVTMTMIIWYIFIIIIAE